MVRFCGIGLIVGMLWACQPPFGLEPPPARDIEAPGLIGRQAVGAAVLELTFDEAVTSGSFLVDGQARGDQLFFLDNRVRVMLVATPAPGATATYRLSVTDQTGNVRVVEGEIRGHNPQPAGLEIHEFGPSGAGKRPDFVELVVTKAGNLLAERLVYGRPDKPVFVVELPDRAVAVGDLVLLRAAGASPLPGEISLPDGASFVKTSGLVVVESEEGGAVLDCLVYSSRTSSSPKWEGWGSRLNQDRARWAAESGGWGFGPEGALPAGAADSAKLTATSSLVRVKPGVRSAAAWTWSGSGKASPGL